MALWCKKDKTPMTIRLDGKTVIITGCNTGIGKETAKDLAHRGAKIIMACRDMGKAEPVAEEIRKETGATVVSHKLDLADFQSIRQFAKIILETEPQINILINNAGVLMMCPQTKTKDGFEMQFGTNHLGHFLLTVLLLDRIKESAPARIITVSSFMYMAGEIHWDDINMEKNYSPIYSYSQSKLANILFTRELAKRLKGTGVTTYTLHPGTVQTDIQRHLYAEGGMMIVFLKWYAKLFFKTPVEGAKTTIYCAVAEELKDQSGLYYSDSSESYLLAKAKDEEAAERLWDLSMELTGMKKEN